MSLLRFLLYSILNLGSFICLSQKPDLIFKHINALNGLSHSNVTAIIEDYQGYMWVGTTLGLNKYDGYSINVYKNIPGDSNSLSNSDISMVVEDKDKNLWIGTRKGLNLYQRDKDRFYHHKEFRDKTINYIYEDSQKNIWVCFYQDIYLYNKSTNTFTLCQKPGVNDKISTIYEDTQGYFWISTFKNIYKYRIKDQQFILQYQMEVKGVTSFYEDESHNFWMLSYLDGLLLYDRDHKSFIRKVNNNKSGLLNNKGLSMISDVTGKLWIGTQNGGLCIFDKNSNFFNYTNDPGDHNSISSNTVNTIYRDRNNDIWVGTFSGGVEFIKERKFTHIFTNVYKKNSISNNNISAFCEDDSGNIWIGTDGGGVNIYDRRKEEFIQLKHDPGNPKSISTDVVTYLFKDIKGNIWLGYWLGGLDKYDKEKNEFIHYMPSGNKLPGELIHDCIMYMYEDKKQNLWVATLEGLMLMDKKTNKFINYTIPAEGLKNYISIMLEDKTGNLWIGSWDRFGKLDRDTKSFTFFEYGNKDKFSTSNEKIYALYEDRNGNIWLGTGGGLNFFDKTQKTFKVYGVNDGLPSEIIYGILVDDDENLWLSTTNGICKFNPKTKACENFNISDGLQGNEFKLHSFFKLSTGEMLFGGSNGYNMFKPGKIKLNAFIPPVIISDFKIFNASVAIGADKNSILRKHISQTEEIKLSYKESVFSFDFAALSFVSPEKNQYAYKLENFDKAWSYVGNKRNATYTNLNPGDYIFKVKASNNDGIWNEKGTDIKITITPPYWNTWWFRTGMAIVILGSAISWYKIRINTIKKQKEILEHQVEERTAEISLQKEELATQAKSIQIAYSELSIRNIEVETQGKRLERLYSEMKDSIRAAQLIQQSILPPESTIKESLPESFVLYKPKDVVSGDFYWFDKKDDKIIIAAIDCVGHGVSGAFMSINAHHLINLAIASFKTLNAAKILDKINDDVIRGLNEQDKCNTNNNGMDIALCIIDKDKKRLQYAGANNPLYIFREKKLIQIKGNKFPIGLLVNGKINKFTNHEVGLQEGDTIYIFSDGYADQIGKDDEKLMYPRFRELLLSICEKGMDKQIHSLDKALNDWKENREQLDDILVIGFKV